MLTTNASLATASPLVGIYSRGIHRIGTLPQLLGAEPVLLRGFGARAPQGAAAIAGWGLRPTSRTARRQAWRQRLPYWALEDGFLRSFGTGDRFPPLSMVVDEVGIYYDGTRPSALELRLNAADDLLQGRTEEVAQARALIVRHRLSKYNHAPLLAEGALRAGDRQRVLVVDQTAGDMSVSLGGAYASTFAAMLQAARDENPQATVYVKTHPEAASGRKGGYLTQVASDARTVLLREAVNPLSLIERMDRVYVVSSTMGFEALLAGKPVSCFGLPWYAGWGATDDRQHCTRRTRARSVEELFVAAYWDYSRYLNPVTHRRGSIFDVIDWLAHQRRMAFGEAG